MGYLRLAMLVASCCCTAPHFPKPYTLPPRGAVKPGLVSPLAWGAKPGLEEGFSVFRGCRGFQGSVRKRLSGSYSLVGCRSSLLKFGFCFVSVRVTLRPAQNRIFGLVMSGLRRLVGTLRTDSHDSRDGAAMLLLDLG